MALQGNIETFALPDVLRLLSSTSKTGKLRLEGTRGEGSLWVASGALVAGRTSGGGDGAPTEVLFELLRFTEGDFVFDQDETTDAPGEPVDVEQALGDAESMLEEWRQLESVVPSTEAWLTLSAELPGDDLTVTKDQWRSLVAVAGGRTVTGLGEHLELGELPVLRLVRDLKGLGVIDVAEEAPAGAAPATGAPALAATPGAESASFADSPSLVASEAEPAPPADEVELPPLVGFDEPDATTDLPPLDDAPGLSVVPDADGGGTGDLPTFDTGGLLADEEPAPPADENPADAAEIAKQLASLSPKAAKAVAAAAKATTDEEREEALAALEGEDTSLNRDLLLKFLGSVNS